MRHLFSASTRRLSDKFTSLSTRFPSLQKIIENIGWLTADKFLRMGMGVVIGAWIARYLGPDNFGILNYAGALVGLVSAFATLGLDSIVKRDLVRSPDKSDELLGTMFVLRLVAGIVTYLLLASFLFFSGEQDTTRAVTLIIGSGLVTASLGTVDCWFQSHILSKYTVWTQNVAFAGFSILRILLILLKKPVIYFAWTTAGEVFISGVLLCFSYTRLADGFRTWSFNQPRAVSLLKQSWPLVFAAFAISIYMKIDQVMIGRILGSGGVGIYSAAVRISEIWYFLPMILASSLFPTIVRSKQLHPLEYMSRIQKFFDLNAGLAYAVSVPIFCFSPSIVRLLFGHEYEEASKILSIHIWASIFVFLGVARDSYLLNEGFLKFSLLATTSGALLNIVLNLLLIPSLHGLGAAIATLVAYALSAVASSFFYPPLIRVGYAQLAALAAPVRYTLSFTR
jgi:PST family polysaccharide transporter